MEVQEIAVLRIRTYMFKSLYIKRGQQFCFPTVVTDDMIESPTEDCFGKPIYEIEDDVRRRVLVNKPYSPRSKIRSKNSHFRM
jgi:hypothetical protein